MGAKGTNLPPDGVKKYLNQAGKGPNEWPPKSWGTEQDGTTKTCEPTNPSNLAEEHVVGGYPPIGGTKIDTKLPLSYLYKPLTQGLLSDGGGGLMNRFTLPDGECNGSTKVLIFVTGSGVLAGDMPTADCTTWMLYQNPSYTSFNNVSDAPYGGNQNLWTEVENSVHPANGEDDYSLSLWFRWMDMAPFGGGVRQCMISRSRYYGDEAPEDFPDGFPQFNPWMWAEKNWRWGVWRDENNYITASIQGPYNTTVAYSSSFKEYAIGPFNDEEWYNFSFTWNSSSQDFLLYINGAAQVPNKVKDDPMMSYTPEINDWLGNQRGGLLSGSLFFGKEWRPYCCLPSYGENASDDWCCTPDCSPWNAACAQPGVDIYYNGALDEVAWWNTDLSPAEVLEISSSDQYCILGGGPNNLSMHSKKDNLVSWWQMSYNGYGMWPNTWPQPTWAVRDIAGASAPAAMPSALMNQEIPGWGKKSANLWQPGPLLENPPAPPPGGIPIYPNKPTYPADQTLTGSLVSYGEFVGEPPWIAIDGAFGPDAATKNEALVMLPGTRVELTWQPYPITKPPPIEPAPPDGTRYWASDIMHSGCYSCGGLGPKAYFTSSIENDAPGWPPP